MLTAPGLEASMSRAGNCCDNAALESFWGKLKIELVDRQTSATRQQARLAIFAHVEAFYNRVRLHSALGFKSPVDFEQQTNSITRAATPPCPPFRDSLRVGGDLDPRQSFKLLLERGI
ncbi:MAG TPA: integrase core domain-containing protein [Verrucomicrobiae bacterium]|nr:integrase core domain-containing protein [Verrucomicrobiae bacterium]